MTWVEQRPREPTGHLIHSSPNTRHESVPPDEGGTAGAIGSVGSDGKRGTGMPECTIKGGESHHGSTCSIECGSAKEDPRVKVPCTDSSTCPIPTMEREASECSADRHGGSTAHSIRGAIGGAALGKSWANGEVRTKRQSRSVAAWYTDDIGTVSTSISLVTTGVSGCQRPELKSMVWGFCPSHSVTGKRQKYPSHSGGRYNSMLVHVFPGGGGGVALRPGTVPNGLMRPLPWCR